MKNITYIVSLCFALACTSCNRDKLYYATEKRGFIRLNINWKPSQLEPNGISAYVFDSESGNSVCKCLISNDPNTIDIPLYPGKFDIMVINNTEEELTAIDFVDIENLNTFKAVISANKEAKYANLSSQAEDHDSYLTECDILANALAKSIEIKPKDIYYYTGKPENGVHEINKTIEVSPERQTELIDIEVKVMNITAAAGAPRSHLTAMCEGINLGKTTKFGHNITHEFVLNNKRVDPDNYKLATITKTLVTFGPEKINNQCINNHQLVMYFILVNGETYTVSLDVKDLLETSHDGIQTVHKIRAEITLPETIGNGDGVFQPDIEEWEEVEAELPI